MTIPKNTGYSADARAHLCVNGHVLPIAQLGPDFLVLRNSEEHPPADAEIVLRIDDDESRWRVHLVNGINATQRKTIISRIIDQSV
jgi:hypothetical protein